ncbi:MAG: hypothetical protein HYX62_08620 [Gammaproteobacteria bacterium]|nr:hypothetical protein [Gammaproteobacteria bacterium]
MIATLTLVTLAALYMGIKREERLITLNALSHAVLENGLLLSSEMYRYFMETYDYMAIPYDPSASESGEGRSPIHLKSIARKTRLIMDRLENNIRQEIANREGEDKEKQKQELQLLQEIRAAYNDSVNYGTSEQSSFFTPIR